MATSSGFSVLSSAVCVLLLSQICLAQLPAFGQAGPGRRHSQQREWRIERMEAVEPSRKVQSEAGVIEYWDQNNEQFQGAGVAPYRTTIEQRGLLLPYYSNAPRLAYVIQGNGFYGSVFPGCPETFQSFERSEFRREERREQRSSEEHQKVHRFREGDIIALPAGVASWFYNDGERPVVTFTVADIGNNANQLDQSLRRFELAGSQQQGKAQEREEASSGNVFRGFDVEILAEAFGISRETARKLQGHDERRGNIVRVEKGLQLVRPEGREERGEEERGRERREEERGQERREERERRRQEEQEEEREREERERRRKGTNGLEEAICNPRHRENNRNPARADVYSREAGWVSRINSQKLPILRFLRLSVEGGFLRENAHYAPHWNINAHSILYVIRGRARLQISGNQGQRASFDDEVRQGHIVVVPQNFVVAAQAQSDGFEWVSFKTADYALVSPLAGKSSVFRGLPQSVIANAYRLSDEEASRLKNGRRQEFLIFRPRQQQGGRAAAF